MLRRYSRGSSGLTGRSASQQRTSRKPAAVRRRSVSSGVAKFQGPRQPSKAARKAGSSPACRAAAWTVAMFPAPPHWATRRPPARRAPRSEANSASWSAIQWKVAVEKTTSTVSPPRSRPTRSATRRSTPSPSRLRAASIIDADMSTPITRPSGTRSISSSVRRPEPQPASRMVSSPSRSRRSMTSRPRRSIGVESRSYAAPSQLRVSGMAVRYRVRLYAATSCCDRTAP